MPARHRGDPQRRNDRTPMHTAGVRITPAIQIGDGHLGIGGRQASTSGGRGTWHGRSDGRGGLNDPPSPRGDFIPPQLHNSPFQGYYYVFTDTKFRYLKCHKQSIPKAGLWACGGLERQSVFSSRWCLESMEIGSALVLHWTLILTFALSLTRHCRYEKHQSKYRLSIHS